MLKKKSHTGQIVLHILFILISVLYVLPCILMVSISLTSEAALNTWGYSLFVKEFSLDAYKLVFGNLSQVLNSYKVTIIYSTVSTFLAMIVMSMLAYPLSRKNFAYRKIITFFVFFTMLFSGGMIPNYLLITKYLHLDNTIWVYIIPGLVSAWNVIIIRTGFQALPDSLIESAKLDGASELYICFKIVIPLTKPTLAAIAFLFLVPKWNDWYTAMLYIREPKLYSLQYLLQRILDEAEFLKSLADTGAANIDVNNFPTESFKYAMAIVAAGPVMFIFPFFQKHFARGLTIGAVKG